MTTPESRLAEVRAAIGLACKRAGRPTADVSLVAVSKGRSADAIERLLEAGQRDFGESRVQEAAEKWPGLRQRYPDAKLHMIGRLQSNKAADAAALFDSIHSLDRQSLLDALAATGKAVPCFVQVNLGGEAQKGGLAPDALGDFLDLVRASPLPLAGLMTIPPAELEPGPFFALLNELARRHDVTGLSMGMSADYPTAVMLGATYVRVGSALFEG